LRRFALYATGCDHYWMSQELPAKTAARDLEPRLVTYRPLYSLLRWRNQEPRKRTCRADHLGPGPAGRWRIATPRCARKLLKPRHKMGITRLTRRKVSQQSARGSRSAPPYSCTESEVLTRTEIIIGSDAAASTWYVRGPQVRSCKHWAAHCYASLGSSSSLWARSEPPAAAALGMPVTRAVLLVRYESARLNPFGPGRAVRVCRRVVTVPGQVSGSCN
jgi:hypothetical protein